MARDGATAVSIVLARQAVVLPEVVVHGSVCTGVEELGTDAEAGSILDEAFKNAERLLAMERDRKSTRLLQSPCNLVCRLLLEKKKGDANHTSHSMQKKFSTQAGRRPTGSSRKLFCIPLKPS